MFCENVLKNIRLNYVKVTQTEQLEFGRIQWSSAELGAIQWNWVIEVSGIWRNYLDLAVLGPVREIKSPKRISLAAVGLNLARW